MDFSYAGLKRFLDDRKDSWDDYIANIIDAIYLSMFGYSIFLLASASAFVINYFQSEIITALVYIPLLMVQLIMGALRTMNPQRHLNVLYTECLGWLFSSLVLFNIYYNFSELNRDVSSINIYFLLTLPIFLTFARSSWYFVFKSALLVIGSLLIVHLLVKVESQSSWFLSIAMGYFFGAILNLGLRLCLVSLFFIKETSSKEKIHSYSQMEKMLYPHQIELMKASYGLQATMPVGVRRAVVITFDIQGSSGYDSELIKDIISSMIDRLDEEFYRSYKFMPPSALFFPIKEVGDGFILSVGHPFIAKENMCVQAFEVAAMALDWFKQIARERELKIHCAIGIADGKLATYFTATRFKKFDCHGRSIILATRYESYRKTLFKELNCSGNVIIIRSSVYQELNDTQQAKLVKHKANISVRDDPDVTEIYYLIDSKVANSRRLGLA